MPNTSNPQPPRAAYAAAIAGYTSALDNASLGREAIEELRAILKAVVELSKDSEVILSLAAVGVTLADERHNGLDCAYSDAVEQLCRQKGGSHG